MIQANPRFGVGALGRSGNITKNLTFAFGLSANADTKGPVAAANGVATFNVPAIFFLKCVQKTPKWL
jgi:hypothetical protein